MLTSKIKYALFVLFLFYEISLIHAKNSTIEYYKEKDNLHINKLNGKYDSFHNKKFDSLAGFKNLPSENRHLQNTKPGIISKLLLII